MPSKTASWLNKPTKKPKKEILTWYRALKDNKPCAQCGGVFRFFQLDMDHIPGWGHKFMDVSKMVRMGFSKERIMSEMSKTQLVCKNCHALRTYMRKKGKKFVGEY